MSARRAAPAVLAALVIAHAAANFILVRAHPSDVIQFPHHYIIQAYEAARGADIRYPITYDRNDLFFRFAAPWVRAFGESPVVARLTTTAYWLAALVLAFLAGLAAKDARAGLIAALALAAMDFPNTYSRGFDVHVPRMMWELAVLAPLFASFRPGWRWAAAAAAVAPALGAGFSPSISDAPLFFLGVSGAAGAWVLWQAIRLRTPSPIFGVSRRGRGGRFCRRAVSSGRAARLSPRPIVRRRGGRVVRRRGGAARAAP
ncbi:MAG: hypothetical protein M5R36_11755 [Deltaproteobacteria bacterium]|nr:hypothetical protein [Deltaproteobacteria bacterium]